MRLCRWRWSPKKLFLILAGSVMILPGLLVYYDQCMLLSYTGAYSQCLRSTRANALVIHHDQDLPASSSPEDFQPWNQSTIPATSDILSTLTCDKPYRKLNVTLCPGCLRPKVKHLGSKLREIAFRDNMIPDRPANFFKLREEVFQNLVTNYIITPKISCPYLIAIQPSLLDRRVERDIVRETWASVAKQQSWPNRQVNADVRVVFVVARQIEAEDKSRHDNSSYQATQSFQQLHSEAAQHNDILFLDMNDGYRNLTLKILSAFAWVKNNCPCVQFVLKVDFDTFVNVPLLVDTLLYFEKRLDFSIVGMVYVSMNAVIRGDRWAVSKSAYPMRYFPEYASGCGYVIASKVLHKLVDEVPHFPMFPVEDAFITGVMRRVTGCQLFTLGLMFTHLLDKNWNKCEMLQDTKILGTSEAGRHHQSVWQTFVTNSC